MDTSVAFFMKVSVIVPVFKVENYIEECLRSIAEQSFRDFELVLVDDCSPDNSITIAQKVLDEYKNEINVKFLKHSVNQGLSAARNTGLSAATGEYVIFVDSDDWILPDCLEKLVRKAEECQADVTIGNYEENSQSVASASHDAYEERVYETPDILKKHFEGKELFPMAWNKLVRRDFLVNNNIKFIVGLVHEDEPWSLELAAASRRYAIEKSITYHYRRHSGTLSTNNDFSKYFIHYCNILSNLNKIAIKYGFGDNPLFKEWLERIKAGFFQKLKISGIKKQMKDFYLQIRYVSPSYKLNKKTIHYFLPSFLGFYCYYRFYKHYLG